VAELKKLDFLRSLGAAGWDLSAINPNRLKFLAQLGRRATSQALQRLVPERRYAILAAFLRQSVEEITDEVVDLYDRCLAQSRSAHGSRRMDRLLTPFGACRRGRTSSMTAMWCICRPRATRMSTPMGSTALTSKGNFIAKAFAR
jgi:hypothetical protein